LEAQRRLKELQKQEMERLKQKDHRDKYIQHLRGRVSGRKDSNERNICALDLDVQQKSKIPKPSLEKNIYKNLAEIPNTKIPKLQQIKEKDLDDNLPWKKGDLLDSLDLSNTNMKKLFKNRPKLCDSPGRQNDDKAQWLKENIRESINEWAPKKLEPLPEIKPTKRIVSRKLLKVQIQEKTEEIKENCLKLESNKPDLEHIQNKGKFSDENGLENPKFYRGKGLKDNINKRYQNIDEKDQEIIEELKNDEQYTNNHKSEQEFIQNILKDAEYISTDSKIQDKNEFPIKPQPNIPGKPKKKSKFVDKIKSIPEPKDDFLENELECVKEEEAKLQASLARLDLKALKAKHQANLIELDRQAQELEKSIQKSEEINLKSHLPELNPVNSNDKLQINTEINTSYINPSKNSPINNEIKPNPIKPRENSQKNNEIVIQATKTREKSPAYSEISTHPNSNIPDNVSVFSAHPYPKPRQLPDARSVCSEIPNKKYGYANREVHKIGAVYNEVAARSGRYSSNNPPPQYALPRKHSKEHISLRKPPPGPEYTPDVVKINPNIDLKALLKDLPKWE
jgi:hypothetical protein